MAKHYVNNADFLQSIKDYRDKVQEAKEKDLPKPQVSNYIGECILKIANHLSYKPNFINYSYRDEMISDGIENCLQYIDNFDPAKSSNPFAYFTQIIYYAFLRRIQKEKKQVFIKQQVLSETGISEAAFDTIDGTVSPDMVNSNVEWMQENYNPVNYEPRKSKKTTKKKKETNLEKFTE